MKWTCTALIGLCVCVCGCLRMHGVMGWVFFCGIRLIISNRTNWARYNTWYMDTSYFSNIKIVKNSSPRSIGEHGSSSKGQVGNGSDRWLSNPSENPRERHVLGNEGGILIGLQPGWPCCALWTKLILSLGLWMIRHLQSEVLSDRAMLDLLMSA